MFCVIQEVQRKNVTPGEPLRIEPYETNYSIAGQGYTTFGYCMSSERCERPIRKAYKISVHKSFREKGKVKKQQVSICTMDYYDIADGTSWVGDYLTSSNWEKKQQILRLSEHELVELIYKKLDPLIERITKEFQNSEEGKLKEEHNKIIKAYLQAQEKFVEKYECDREEFRHCYDIFLTLRNPAYLKKVQADHRARQQYRKQSWENDSSYYEKFRDNYGSGYSDIFISNHTEKDKEILKQFYRVLSKRFHPDANTGTDTSEQMKVLNQLKQEWRV